MTAPKIVTLDIETSPIEAYTWGIWQQNIGLNQIKNDWSILSYCAKTLGDREIRYEDVFGQKDLRDDSKLMKKLWVELDQADIVVGQNVQKFDKRKINARFLTLGMLPPSPYKLIDTLLEARKVAMFTSGKLEWLSAVLTDVPKDKHKDFPGFELWAECLKGNPKAWAAMRKYNPRDVVATEKVYLKLRPWIIGHPNLATGAGLDIVACPKCGSVDIHPRGYITTQVGVYQRYRCDGCGGWSRGRYDLNGKQQRRLLLSN